MFALRERRIHVTQEDFEMSVAKVMKKDLEKNMAMRKLWTWITTINFTILLVNHRQFCPIYVRNQELAFRQINYKESDYFKINFKEKQCFLFETSHIQIELHYLLYSLTV